MHLVELFSMRGDPRSRQTRRLISEVVEERDDVLFVCHDVEEPAGREKAARMDVHDVPTTIIDRERVMIGVPNSKDQVMRSLG